MSCRMLDIADAEKGQSYRLEASRRSLLIS